MSSYAFGWSADGREILVGRSGGDEGAIWLVPSDGGVGCLIEGTEGSIGASWTPDGQVAFTKLSGLWQVPAEGGGPELLIESVRDLGVWSTDGQQLFVWMRGEPSADIWSHSMRDGSMRAMTDLAGKYGVARSTLAADDNYLYFTWQEDVGDIWVMDVVTDERD